jgi:hypothetical protein
MTMADEMRWLDGNAVAGLLVEVFGAEMTTAVRGCASCGAQRPVGAHRAYVGMGAVLRCPVCGDVGLRVTALPDRHVVRLSGTWTFELPP